MEQAAFEWTALPYLPLQGLGTKSAESLDFYSLRLCWATGWSVSQLSHLFALPSEKGRHRLPPSYYLFGARREAQVALMERMMGNPDMRYSTLWVLKDVLNTKGLYRAGSAPRRWCPVCYDHWDPESSWEPMVWQLPSVGRCPIHDCDLVDQCEECGASQSRLVSIDRRDRCDSCGASLGAKGVATPRPKFYDWVENETFNLVAFCSTPGQACLPGGTVAEFAEGIEALARDAKVLQMVRRCLALQRGESFTGRLSLNGFINLAALLGTSVVHLLTHPKEAMSAPLLDLWSNFHWICDPFVPQDDAIRATRWLARKVMTRCDRWYIPSMRTLCKDMNVSPSRLKAFDPETYGAYIGAYTSQCTPAVRYTRGIGFTAARSIMEGKCLRAWNHHRQWWLPKEVEKANPVTLEDAYCSCYSAMIYARHLATASGHASGAMQLKDDTRWLEIPEIVMTAPPSPLLRTAALDSAA